MFHFEEIGAMAIDHGAGRQIHDAAGLAGAVADYFAVPAARHAAGEAARELVAMNRGALDRTLELMQESLATGERCRKDGMATSAGAGPEAGRSRAGSG
jgi:3-deoxy-D-manno-octulosonic-acid transferase